MRTVTRIDTKRGRDALAPRREPYWYKLARDRHLGLRKLTSQSPGTWIARHRDDVGDRQYKSLGECTDRFDFDCAKTAAEAWFRDRDQGVRERDDAGAPATVATACMCYVRALRTEGRAAAAHDAHMRFRRTVYGATADPEFGPKAHLPHASEVSDDENHTGGTTNQAARNAKPRKWALVAQPIAAVPLSRIRAPAVRRWHVDLVTAGLSKASANRTLSALKAALNLAVTSRMVSPLATQEWAEVTPFKDATRRRDLFLDVTQRRALLNASQGGIRRLLEAVMHTGCRAGELTSARRASFDARTKSLNVTGKTGPRAIPLTDAAVTFFSECAKNKLPAALLLTRDDGRPWAHSDWDQLVKAAASSSKLSPATCLYTLRHSFITQALLDGVSTLEVSKIVGTSLAMIEKHYGHLVHATARERLSKVQMI